MSAILAPPAKRGTTRRQRDELYALIESGYFGEAKVELIGGELVTAMPEPSLHDATVERIFAILSGLMPGCVYRQDYIELPQGDAVQPDVFVLQGDSAEQPLLVVEVALGTLRRDRTIKSELYAAAGTIEYWIVNPRARQIEVRTDASGSEYVVLGVFGEGDTLRPLFAPEHEIAVGRLIPPPDRS